MTEIITEFDLASYPGITLGDPTVTDLVVRLTNGLVSEVNDGTNWIRDLDPMPVEAVAIALEVAARPFRNPEGATSISRSVDDWTKTVRWEASSGDHAARAGVHLTDAEKEALLALLDTDEPARRYGSIRLAVPGYRHGTFGC